MPVWSRTSPALPKPPLPLPRRRVNAPPLGIAHAAVSLRVHGTSSASARNAAKEASAAPSEAGRAQTHIRAASGKSVPAPPLVPIVKLRRNVTSKNENLTAPAEASKSEPPAPIVATDFRSAVHLNHRVHFNKEALNPAANFPVAVPIGPPARKTSAAPSALLSAKTVRIAPSRNVKAIASRNVHAAKANVHIHHRVSVHRTVTLRFARRNAAKVSVRTVPSGQSHQAENAVLPAAKANAHIHHQVSVRHDVALRFARRNAARASARTVPSGQSRQAENAALHAVKTNAPVALAASRSQAVVNAATANRRIDRAPAASNRARRMPRLVRRPVRGQTSAEASASRAHSVRASPAVAHPRSARTLPASQVARGDLKAMQNDSPASVRRAIVPAA